VSATALLRGAAADWDLSWERRKEKLEITAEDSAAARAIQDGDDLDADMRIPLKEPWRKELLYQYLPPGGRWMTFFSRSSVQRVPSQPFNEPGSLACK
jgi:hypothetical protein